MICPSLEPTFRLLDHRVGWETSENPRRSENVLADSNGLRIDDGYPAISESTITPWMPPAWIAWSRCEQTWYRCGVRSDNRPFILKYQCFKVDGAVSYKWIDLRRCLAGGDTLGVPKAIAVTARRLAILDQKAAQGSAKLRIWSLPDGRCAGEYTFDDHVLLQCVVFTSWGELLVGGTHIPSGTQRVPFLWRFDRVAGFLGSIKEAAKENQQVDRLANKFDGHVLAAIHDSDGTDGTRLKLFQVNRESHWHADDILKTGSALSVVLNKTLYRTGLLFADDQHFQIESPCSIDNSQSLWFDRSTLLVAKPPKLPLPQPKTGTYVTGTIDSHIPRCQWHRVRLEAEIPLGCGIQCSVATTEKPLSGNGDATAKPKWQDLENNACDFLIDRPAGRFLLLKIKLFGTTASSPIISRVQIDFPRSTSLEHLPVVFRDPQDTENFLERFLAMFDASIEDIDHVIEHFAETLNPATTSSDYLPWLGKMLGISFDSQWDTDTRRKLLAELPSLYRQRGTPTGLKRIIALLFGQQVAIDEPGLNRPWGAVNGARLGSVRLFGQGKTRFLLDQSILGASQLNSHGQPSQDPITTQSHRFHVALPVSNALSAEILEQLQRVVVQQKPAHTLHSVSVAKEGFVLGKSSRIGLETKLDIAPPSVLFHPKAESHLHGLLGINTVLRPASGTLNFQLGVRSSVGLHTLLE